MQEKVTPWGTRLALVKGRWLHALSENCACCHPGGWVEILPGRTWSWWLSCHDSGDVLGGSGVTFKGALTDGTQVARTYDGREWLWVSPR